MSKLIGWGRYRTETYESPPSTGGGAPSGAAGGNLGGTYPNPDVLSADFNGVDLTFGAVADGEILKRVGASIVGVALPTSGTVQASVFQSNIFDTSVSGPDVWNAVTGSDFSYAGSADFVLTAAGCILTYGGASGRTFLVVLSISIDLNSTHSHAMAISHNGDLVGGAALNSASVVVGAQYGSADAGQADTLTVQRRVTLNATDTLRPLGAIFGVTEDMTINSLSLTVIPE